MHKQDGQGVDNKRIEISMDVCYTLLVYEKVLDRKGQAPREFECVRHSESLNTRRVAHTCVCLTQCVMPKSGYSVGWKQCPLSTTWQDAPSIMHVY